MVWNKEKKRFEQRSAERTEFCYVVTISNVHLLRTDLLYGSQSSGWLLSQFAFAISDEKQSFTSFNEGYLFFYLGLRLNFE